MASMRKLGEVNALYPSLTTVLGTVVDGRVNFVAVAHVGIMNHSLPQYLTFGLNKAHYSNRGIREHGTFSVNIPGRDMMVQTDCAGIVSGKKTDKSGLFETFTGELENAPMIVGCPVCMECRVKDVLDFRTHEVFVGELVNTYAAEDVLGDDGKIDLPRVHPLLFDMASGSYYGLGEPLGPCWSVGKELANKLRGK